MSATARSCGFDHKWLQVWAVVVKVKGEGVRRKWRGRGVWPYLLTAGVFCRMPCKMHPSTFAALIAFRVNVGHMYVCSVRLAGVKILQQTFAAFIRSQIVERRKKNNICCFLYLLQIAFKFLVHVHTDKKGEIIVSLFMLLCRFW